MKLLRRLVDSPGEARLYELAKSVFGSAAPARVHLKVRLADVFNFESPIWTAEERRFSLASHFDLIITDDNLQPTLALEFDGLQHNLEVQAQRDNLKDGICRKVDLPLLRVRWDDLRRPVELAQKLRELEEPPTAVESLERILCLEVAVKLAGHIVKRQPLGGILQTAEDVIRLAEGVLRTRYLRPTAEEAKFWYSNYSPEWHSEACLPDGCQTKWRFLVLSVVINMFPISVEEVEVAV